MSSKQELETRVETLEEKIRDFEIFRAAFEHMQKHFGEMVEKEIKGKLYYQAVENIEAYRKGALIAARLDDIKKVLE